MIAATNRDIIKAISEDHFREDLFHRLNVVQLCPPPLRERVADIILLAEHFLAHFSLVMNKRIGGLSAAARHKLSIHHWPGNVRELRNALERAVILETTEEVQAASLPDFRLETRLRKADPAAPAASLEELKTNYEREVILNMLEQNDYNLNKTAEQLKLTRHQLRYRMQRLNLPGGLDPEDDAAANGKEAVS